MKTYLTSLFVLFYSVLFSQLDSVKTYYKKVAFGNEFTNDTSGERKWENDVKIFVLGKKDPELMTELSRIVKELNDLIIPINIQVVDNKDNANVLVLFGSKQDFINLDKTIEPYVKLNEGLFKINHEGKKITNGEMYVNTEGTLTEKEKKHLLREELTQLLGLCNDSYKYKNSIFYQGWTDTTEYAEIDKELIKLLYNK
jgi:hypothetical protein